MPLAAISSDYSGSDVRVDLSIFPDLGLPNRAVVSAAGRDGMFSRAVAGPAKAAQNYGRILLTPLGSVRSRPSLGSRLRERVNAGEIRYPADLAQVFAAENLRTFTFLAGVSAGRPDDERIATATLADTFVAPGGIELKIALTMRSGDATTLRLPVAWSL